MVMILLFKEMLKGNVRTYVNGKVARQKKEVWLREHRGKTSTHAPG